jgi:hypothetical protein
MAWNPLTPTSSIITVVTAGVPVNVIASHKSAQSVLIQALPNNTGRIVVGYDNTVRANVAGTNPSGTVLAILGAPASNTATPPSANGGNPSAPAALNLQQFWIDASVSGEGCLVSFIV